MFIVIQIQSIACVCEKKIHVKTTLSKLMCIKSQSQHQGKRLTTGIFFKVLGPSRKCSFRGLASGHSVAWAVGQRRCSVGFFRPVAGCVCRWFGPLREQMIYLPVNLIGKLPRFVVFGFCVQTATSVQRPLTIIQVEAQVKIDALLRCLVLKPSLLSSM